MVKIMSNLILNGNDATGMSGYGAQLSKNLSGISSADIKEQIEMEKLAAASAELEANKGWKSAENKKVQATGFTVIFTKYNKNPYRKYKSNAGLLLDVDSFHINDAGEMEQDEMGVICCHVVSVGPECKYVKEGDDIYIRNVGAAPVPFDYRGYWAISEQNVICRIVNND